jgi:hypothetical protein
VVSRRNAVALFGSVGLGIVTAACGKSASSTATTAGSSSTTAACVLLPEVTQGPCYPDLNKVRGDITEGRPGAALDLRITVVDATRCTPINKDAAVDIWHCDTCAEVVKQRNGDGMVGEELGVHRARAIRRCLKRFVGRHSSKLLERCDQPGVEILRAA